MATLRKRKRRRFRIEAVAAILFTLSLGAVLFSSLFLNTRMISLTMEKQRLEDRVAMLREENQLLTIEIQTLENKERVYTIAQESGLEQNQANIISVHLGN